MRLGLYYTGSAPDVGVTWYNIGIMDGDGITMRMFPPPVELPQLHAQLSRIEAMAKQVLGDDFLHLSHDDTLPALQLAVRVGVSNGNKKAEWRDLCGWIALSNLESSATAIDHPLMHHQV